MKRSRMFHLWQEKPIKTWNPFIGCRFDCRYCWAKRLAKRLRCDKCRSFTPHVHEERLNPQRIPKSGIVFVSDMGDISFAPTETLRKICEVINKIHEKHDVTFFFQSKNPSIFGIINSLIKHGERVIFSTTIETNRDDIASKFSRAPKPSIRCSYMEQLSGRKHISIEPIMNFDLDILFNWITSVKPEAVSIGYDNYHNNLPEPPVEKTLELIRLLEESGIKVEKKTIRNNIRGWDEK